MQLPRDELRTVPPTIGGAPDLDRSSAPDAPRELFLRWLRYAIETGVPEARAATLSTVDEDGFPDARVLAVKDVTEGCGFKISSSAESPKGRQLQANPHCALTFYWSPLARAVRVRGVAQRASAEESAADFLARHPDTRAYALAGQQSSIISDSDSDVDDSEVLTRAKESIEVDGGVVSPHWAVWTIVSNSVEFWQGDTSRNHHRLRYVRTAAGWDKQRLWP